MSQSNNNSNWTFWLIILGLGMLAQLFAGGNSSSSSSRSTFQPDATDRGTFEHRYVTERFKQEGFSGSDARTAADAVIKFHNAQQAREH